MARKSLNGNNIYLRKDGRWEGRRRIGVKNGKTVFSYIYAASYEEAVHKLEELAVRQTAEPFVQENGSFQNIAREWLELQRPQLKPASLSSYMNILNSYLEPQFGSRNISDISRAEFTAFFCKLLECGGSGQNGLSPSTVSTILTVAKNILHYASREKGITVADIQGIPVRQPRQKPVTLSREQQAACSTGFIRI